MVVQGARRLCSPFPTQGPRSVETAPRLPLSTLSSPPTNVCLTVIHRVKGAAQNSQRSTEGNRSDSSVKRVSGEFRTKCVEVAST